MTEPSSDPSGSSSTPQRRWPGPRSGRGLVIGAVGTGAVGWGLTFGAIAVARRSCPPPDGCVYSGLALSLGRSFANATAVGLAIPAGLLAGRYDASHRAHLDARRRERAFVAVGASTLAVGTAGMIATWVVRLTVPPPDDATAYLIGHALRVQFSAALTATGAGLLGYGLGFRRSRAEAVHTRLGPLRVPGGGGLSVSGRF